MNGSGVLKNDVVTVKWFKKTAAQGLASAQCILLLYYMNGIGVSKDETIAAKWFTKAAEQGDKDAQYELDLYNESSFKRIFTMLKKANNLS